MRRIATVCWGVVLFSCGGPELGSAHDPLTAAWPGAASFTAHSVGGFFTPSACRTADGGEPHSQWQVDLVASTVTYSVCDLSAPGYRVATRAFSAEQRAQLDDALDALSAPASAKCGFDAPTQSLELPGGRLLGDNQLACRSPPGTLVDGLDAVFLVLADISR